MTPQQIQDFLVTTRDAAVKAQHVWPEYVACEAALESAWGTSELYLKANNAFGTKQSLKNPRFGTIDFPTHEWMHGELEPTMAHWINYPDLATCFQDRMALIRRLAPARDKNGQLLFPGYFDALGAPDGETFVMDVSRDWSSDPNRGAKVLQIYNAHKGVF